MSRFAKSTTARDVPALPFEQCYAKTAADGTPGMTVLEHCRVVGCVARALCRQLPDSANALLGSNPALAAALHDVGKVSPGYQLKYFRRALAEQRHPLAKHYGGFDDKHARVGEQTLAAVYGQGGSPPVAQVAGAHHGSREECVLHGDAPSGAEGSEWPRERRSLIAALEAEFGPLGEAPAHGLPTMLLSGLTCVADWIASDERVFDPAGLPESVKLPDMAAEAVRQCGWRSPQIVKGLSFLDVFGFAPLPAQAEFSARIAGAGIHVLEAPTGSGKTETALFAAYRLLAEQRARGLYFALPTRLTSERIHRRVDAFLDKICTSGHAPRLAHGTAWLSRHALEIGPMDRNPENDAQAWFNPLKRALLHPFGVGTVDQALLGVLNVRHFFLRLFGLAGKVVILDEVHTYDLFTGTHLDELVRLLRELDCTVIVLSATLTEGRRGELLGLSAPLPANAYPLLSNDCGEVIPADPPPPRNVQIRMVDWPDERVAETAVEAAAAGASVLCIANTVAQAQVWHRAVRAAATEDSLSIGLLHSKFIGAHRSAKEQIWMQRLGKTGDRSAGCVLVATQVVEQSVDIDGDLLITELAPTDMLIQRIGRLWRHPRDTRPFGQPRVVLVGRQPPTEGEADELLDALGRANAHVYSPYVLCRSFEVWQQFDGDEVALPDQVRALLEDTYRERSDEPPLWQELRRRQERENQKLQRFARAVQAGTVGMPVGRDEEGAKTRYNDRPMKDVLLVVECDDRGLQAAVELLSGERVELSAFQRDIHAAAKLHRNTLRIPAYLVSAIATPKWLAKTLHEGVVPLIRDSDGTLRADNKPTGLAYDEIHGLVRHPPVEARTSPRNDWLDETLLAYTDCEQEDELDELGHW